MPAYKINEYDLLNRSPGFKLAARGWADLVSSDLAPLELTLGYDNQVITASDGDKVVGVLVWLKQDFSKSAFVVLGYVEKEYRGKGIYRRLDKRLEAAAKKAGLRRVVGGVAIGNKAMRATAERLGRVPESIYYARDF